LEEVIRRHGENLFLIFTLGALAPLFFYETEFNKPFIFSFKYLSAPVLGVFFYISLTKMPAWNQEIGRVKALAWTFLCAAIFVLLSGGYVIAINALFGPQKNLIIEGVVSDLTVTRGSRGKSYHIAVEDSETHEIKKLVTTKREIELFRVGDHYAVTWKVGSLGILYKAR